jgi:hypothetical protein
MNIFNNSPKPNRIHYKVDGKTFHFDIKGFETVDIPLLTDVSQIIGKHDRKTLESIAQIDSGTLNGYLKARRLNIKLPESTASVLPTTFNMRSLLSAAGQTRFDAAGNNQWFLVDRTDYEAVRAAALAEQYVMKDEMLYTEENLNSFAANLPLTFGDANYPHAAIPAGQRIIGFTYRTQNAFGGFQASIRLNNSFKGGAGTQIGNTLVTNYLSSTQTFCLLKNATFVTEEKSYVIQTNNLGSRRTTAINYPMAYSSAFPNWTDWTNTVALIQVIATELTPE